jgi:ABC-type iron transport system FetAB permease component
LCATGDAIVAAKYQIVIMFGIGASGTLAAMLSMGCAAMTLTDEKHCLRLDRLQEQSQSLVSRVWCAPAYFALPFAVCIDADR